MYRRGPDGEDWVFSQKLTGAEAGEPWVPEHPEVFPFSIPGFFTIAADEDDLLIGLTATRRSRDDGVFAYRLRDATDDGVHNPVWLFDQKITRAVQGSHAVITGVFPVGKAYVFELRDDTRWEWTGQALRTSDSPDHPPPKGPGPAVLAAPAIDGDWLIMGAGSPGSVASSAFLYQWDPAAGRWAFRQEIAPAEPQEGAGFGSSTALGGGRAVVAAFRFDVDADGDGTPDVKDAGAAYVFERQGGVWREVARLQHPQPRAADVFGGSLGCVSLTETHALVGMFVNSKGFNGRPRLSGTNAGSAVVYAVPR